MERLIEILEGIEEGVDYKNCKTLIDDHYLDSLAIISFKSLPSSCCITMSASTK